MVRTAENTDRWLAIAALAAGAIAAGCRADPATALVVEVWSDLDIPAEIDGVRVGVKAAVETLDLPFALSAAPAAGHWTLPLRVALVPRAAKDQSFSVRVAGSLGAVEKVAQEARVAFLPGQARVLTMFLARACQGVSCADPAYTCDRGKCTLPKERKPEDLPKFDPGKPPDGAPAPDAGAEPMVEAEPDAAADLAPDLGADKAPDLAADPPPSCVGLPETCGPSGTESCCASGFVPERTYNRSNDAMYPATVSDFQLDRFEITVGRFRKFVEAGMGTMASPPAAGSGENPSNPTGTGWNATWNSSLPADTAALKTAVKCSGGYQTWTDSPGANENRPMNCIDWYEAFAFCIWDGGRLASEAEWNYAAAGGSEQRSYPWGSAAADDSYAVSCGGSCGSTQNVGAKSPKGDGKWGQADLAGNVWEWNFDWYGTYIKPCTNCANTTTATYRVLRGGSFYSAASSLLSSYRFNSDPTFRVNYLGSRCARTP